MKKIFLIMIGVMLLFSVTAIVAAEDVQPQQEASGRRQSWLGIKNRTLTPALAQQMGLKYDKGVLLLDVIEGGPAAKAGLKKGDVIVQCEGVNISENAQIITLVSVETPGTILPIKIIRDGNYMTFNVTLGEPGNQVQPAITFGNGEATENQYQQPQSEQQNQVKSARPKTIKNSASSVMEVDTDRAGSDYRSFKLSMDEPELCQDACIKEETCKAWTYVKPGIQGQEARCWLKHSIPQPNKNVCCVSGVKEVPIESPADQQYQQPQQLQDNQTQPPLAQPQQNQPVPQNDDAETCYKRGLDYRNTGNYQQSVDEFTKAIQLKPDYASAYNSRGLAYKHMGNYQQAIDDYTKAIELRPDFANAFNNRGQAYVLSGNEQQSINDFKTAAKLGHKKAQDELTRQGIQW